MPEEVIHLVEGATFIFLTISVAAGTGYLRNITGYAVKWLSLKRQKSVEEIDYSFTWMVETVGKFEMVLVTATPFLEMLVPSEHKAAVMLGLAGLFAFIDILYSETKTLWAAVKKPG